MASLTPQQSFDVLLFLAIIGLLFGPVIILQALAEWKGRR